MSFRLNTPILITYWMPLVFGYLFTFVLRTMFRTEQEELCPSKLYCALVWFYLCISKYVMMMLMTMMMIMMTMVMMMMIMIMIMQCAVCMFTVSLREADMPATDLVSKLASKYRYSGRTQYQVQLASSMSASATLDRSATIDRSTTASVISSRKYTGGSKSLENGSYRYFGTASRTNCY